MGTPFGFMAFSGVASLIGVIVSHVIVLFDFIEDMHEKGEPLERALPDAGIERIRPVMITVGATILALFPLALEAARSGNLCAMPRSAASPLQTFITLLLVRSFYSIFVLDLKWIKWEITGKREWDPESETATAECLGRRTMPSRRELLKAGAMTAMAGVLPSSVTFADPMPCNRNLPRAPSGQTALAWSSPFLCKWRAVRSRPAEPRARWPKIDPKYTDLPASKWYDYGFKKVYLGSSKFLTGARSRSLPHMVARPWICILPLQKKSFSVGTKQPDTGKPGPPNSL